MSFRTYQVCVGTRRAQAGLSLVELMVALVAGLIVTGAVLAFTLSSLRVNSEYVRATRLTLELRNSLNFIAEDLRRAGYDEDAMNYVARPASFTQSSPFATIQVLNAGTPDGCVVYAYDRGEPGGNAGVVDLARGEIRAIRRMVRNGVGVVEFAQSSGTTTPTCDGASPDYTTYPPTCSSSGWCALSDPRVVDITSLRLTTSGFHTAAGSGTALGFQIRRIGVELQGRLVENNNSADVIQRGVRADVRVRADCIRNNPGANCTNTPTGT
jgi:hypothetical protein